jgi:hypothetical protein
MSDPSPDTQQAPHILLLPSNLHNALFEYLSKRPFGEVARLCQALGALKKIHLTSIQPPEGATAEVVASPPNGRDVDTPSTPSPTEE